MRLNLLLILAIFMSNAHDTRGSIYIDSEEDLSLLIHSFANNNVDGRIKQSDLPDMYVGDNTEERLLKGLAYIPLKEQPLHKSYWTEGFPEMSKMLTETKYEDGRPGWSALPNFAYNFADKPIIYIYVDERVLHTSTKLTDLTTKCKLADKATVHHCDTQLDRPGYEIFACDLNARSTEREKWSPLVLDMFGFLALKINNNTSDDVFLKALATGKISVTRTHPIGIMSYSLESNYPRVMWPAWVNLYLLLKNSNHICHVLEGTCNIWRRSKQLSCKDLISNVYQLSSTYAYFVCRIQSGNAGDKLCPSVCREDPCSKIQNAINGTCQTIGFQIHRFDFFCFCKRGFLWHSVENAHSAEGGAGFGRCIESPASKGFVHVEECTWRELETFCYKAGTKLCSIDRMSDNRRPQCTCHDNYSGVNCGYRITGICDHDGFKGHILCRTHERAGTCQAVTGSPVYNCRCNSTEHIRWKGSPGEGESCRQWIPSEWHDRAISCGFLSHLTDRDQFRDHCNNVGCDREEADKYLHVMALQYGCTNGLGSCVINKGSGTSSCVCPSGRSGNHCQLQSIKYAIWTPWSICYPRGVVRPRERVSLRYRSCRHMIHPSNGSAAQCIDGETEYQTCPDVPEDLKKVLTPSDYGIASQAVISMWRLVELMMLVDFVLVLILAALLLYQRATLKAQKSPADIE